MVNIPGTFATLVLMAMVQWLLQLWPGKALFLSLSRPQWGGKSLQSYVGPPHKKLLMKPLSGRVWVFPCHLLLWLSEEGTCGVWRLLDPLGFCDSPSGLFIIRVSPEAVYQLAWSPTFQLRVHGYELGGEDLP